MYLVKTPRFIQNLFPNFVWNIPDGEKVIYLTFDDGPIPQVTPWVLKELAKYEATATFFCVGQNIEKYPDIFEQTVEEGHTVGGHTYNHLNGWTMNNNIDYYHNVRKCAALMDSSLFRPPYGRLKPTQAQFLQRHYNIIMWDVLSGDFDHKVTEEQCLKNVLNNTRQGSIVVFHDSIKAKENLTYVLPRVLEHFSELGYVFRSIRPDMLASAQPHAYSVTA